MILCAVRARALVRGIKTVVSDLRKGDWLEYDGRIQSVLSTSSTISGRGSRTFTLTLKDIASDSQTTMKPTCRDQFEKVDGYDEVMTFMYVDAVEDVVYLCNKKTFAEVTVPRKMLLGGPNLERTLEGGVDVRVRMIGDGRPVLVQPSSRTLRATVAEILNIREGTKA